MIVIVQLSGIYGSKPTESEEDSPRTRFVYVTINHVQTASYCTPLPLDIKLRYNNPGLFSVQFFSPIGHFRKIQQIQGCFLCSFTVCQAQKELTLNRTPPPPPPPPPPPHRVIEGFMQLTCDDTLLFANDQQSLNTPVFQLHASASRCDVDKLIVELEELSASTHIILLHVAMDNTITMNALFLDLHWFVAISL